MEIFHASRLKESGERFERFLAGGFRSGQHGARDLALGWRARTLSEIAQCP
jgi:isopentenyl diphosphate isomerase/L-lactate dehydrogenase-like FMN-dependent dehydrogenase